jgi:putative spermidine/putrescine transport system permease protein
MASGRRLWLLGQKVFLGAVVFIVCVPYIPILIQSVGRKWFWPNVIPAEFTLEGWRYVFSSSVDTFGALWLTLAVALATTLLTILIGLPAGKVLGERTFRGKRAIEFLLLAPLIVPKMTIGLGLLVMFYRLRLAGTVIGVILAHLIPTTPYMIRVMASVFESLDSRAEEQARTLGATPFRAFVHITLPAIMPGIVAGSIFVFLISVNQFVLTFLVGGGHVVTLPILMFNFIGPGGGQNPAIGASMSLILTIPGLLFLIATERMVKEEFFSMTASAR